MVLDFLKNESYTIVTNMRVFKNCIHTHTGSEGSGGKITKLEPTL